MYLPRRFSDCCGFSARPGKQLDDACDGQIGDQNQQRQNEDIIELFEMLQFLDFGCQNHGVRADDKDDGTDGNHRADKVIAEDFSECPQRVRRDDAPDGLQPAVAHQAGRGLPGGIHLFERLFHHQVRCRKIMDNRRNDNQEEGALQAGTRKGQHVGDTEHHTRYGVDDEGKGIQRTARPVGQAAARGDEPGRIGKQRAEKRRHHGRENRVEIGLCQFAVGQHIVEMLPGRRQPVRPALDGRHDEDDGKNTENHEADQKCRCAPSDIPCGVFRRLNFGTRTVADIETFHISQQQNADDGRNQHHDGDNGAPAEIRQRAEHLVVQQRCDHIRFAADRHRNTVIGKAEKEALNQRGSQRADQRAEDCRVERAGRLIAEHAGNNLVFRVDILQRVVDQHVGNRQCVDNVADRHAGGAVDVKKLMAAEQCPREQSFLAECVDNGETVGDRRQQHRQKSGQVGNGTQRPGNAREVYRVGNGESEQGSQRRTQQRDADAVAHSPPELRRTENITVGRYRKTGIAAEGPVEDEKQRNDEEEGEQRENRDQDDSLLLFTVFAHTAAPSGTAAASPAFSNSRWMLPRLISS